MKTCTQCGQEKELTAFSLKGGGRSGHRSECKVCRQTRERGKKRDRRAYYRSDTYLKRRREHYAKNKAKIATSNAAWFQSLKGRFATYKRAAAARQHVWRLTLKQFQSFWQKPCVYCGAQITTIGLDRIDATKGYRIDNVVACCTTCNRMKGTLTMAAFLAHVAQISRFQERA